ncbi:transcriptional regulator, TetR family [Marvinbryantia formatexigens DSM 14469]|uniref:Transcriptional regulator, TetR family n=2 Tax=Marvinbryantia TaxID=248744 RepID=C6LAL1_9FIRM|nr:transcriptional regulator, TetR family [Marvinbryantia formatexigens DSM 14469]
MDGYIMRKTQTRNTKGKIIAAAWKLFYEQGYEDTTVDEIIRAAQTSKGSFYHYFSGKDALLSTLAYLFDEKYEELLGEMDESMGSFEKLIYLNNELFTMIEDSISIDLLARLLSTQLITRGEKSLLDRNRLYYRLLRQIISEGQEKGELRADVSVGEIVKIYALCERSFLYDWCISGGEYSLRSYSQRMLPMLLADFRL